MLETTSHLGKNVLVVDDDRSVRLLVDTVLTGKGYDVTAVATAREALQNLKQGSFQVMVLDIVLDDMNGLDVLKKIQSRIQETQVIMMTSHANTDTAVEALGLGAFDYMWKGPQIHEELIYKVNKAFEDLDLRRSNQRLQQELHRIKGFAGIVGESAPMKQLYKMIHQVADTDASVLIRGETGTGKELIAQAIHEQSNRSDQPMVVVDCNIPEAVAEAELFGVTANYPGFHRLEAHTGLVELADGGSLFFDEVGDLTMSTQAKILRTLQELEVRPLGADRAKSVDIRVIGATNRNLEAEITEQRFREDLYYRLNVVSIEAPPLRDRRDDIPLLTNHFLARACTRLKHAPVEISNEAMDLLINYDYPGNVRELENIIDRTVILATDSLIGPNLIMINQRNPGPVVTESNQGRNWLELTLPDAHSVMEKTYLERVLTSSRGNISEAARTAGIDRKNFRQKLQKHEISAATFKKSIR